ncbi:MAG TPA: glycosyltransferase [Pyrinomonadaceae bacterium]
MRFSVLLCTYNRPELLDRALSSLIETTHEKPDEIVIVNGGDRRADRIVENRLQTADCTKIQVKLITTVNKNLAASRNIGLPHCDGDIIATTDDDAEVFPDWVTLMKQAHQEHPEAGAIGGLVLGTNTDSLVGKVADLITFPSWQEPQYVRTLPGVNISYKRQVVENVGLQDETLFRGEDVDYNWRVQQLGYKIYFDPRIKVHHHHRPTVKAFLNQHYMYGRAYYLVRRKWPEMYCVYPRGIHRFRDVLKVGDFFAALVYEPFRASRKACSLRSRLSLLPMIFMAEFAWKGGMLMQARRESESHS